MQQTLYVPYLRTSPLYIPRRDIVLTATDSLSLRVTVVERDNPNAQLMVVTGGIGGPAARMVVWTDYGNRSMRNWCDYGFPHPAIGTVLWTAYGAPQINLGSFDWFVPFATVQSWPLRCGWGVQLAWDGGEKSELLMRGTLHVSGIPTQETTGTGPLLTDDSIPVLEDDTDPVYT